MLAAVKTPHIEIKVKGKIPEDFLEFLKAKYGKKLSIEEDPGNESVDIFETNWYKKVKASMKPFDNLRYYREIRQMTQAQLAEKLGIPRQHVSNMENGKRGISLTMAKNLAKIFNTSVERFI